MKPVLPFLPQEPGLRAHVFRVAALASRAAEVRGCTESQIEMAQWAGLLHHYPVELGFNGAVQKIFTDLGVEAPGAFGALPEGAAEIVRSFRGLGTNNSRFTAEAVAYLEGANYLDEQMENLPYEESTTELAIEELLRSGMIRPPFQAALMSFRTLSRQQLMEAAKRLPVFPKAALEALRLSADPSGSTTSIERALSKDPVLAGEIVQLANSATFGSSYPVGSLGVALTRVGTIAAGKLISAAAVRRCFVSSALHQLWAHSFETAEQSAAMASESGKVSAGEAFLAGLVHDVGRLAFELSHAAADLRRWTELGFPISYSEFLVSGTDHATIGAEILKSWRFPDSIVDGVRYHHRPELTPSRLAALVHAVEDFNEALPSCARDHLASKRLDIDELRQNRAASAS